jgi:hypothetical protein
MRIFSVKTDGKFEEFSQTDFQIDHQESILEKWLEDNSDDILEDGKLLIIGRQVITNLGSIIDLLGIDREGNTVVIELKRNRTPRDTLAQALEYASFVEELEVDQLEAIFQRYVNDDGINLATYHNSYFDILTDEAVSFNKDQRMVLVGERVSREIRQTSSFLRKKGIRVTCLEFSYFQATGGEHLLSYDIVVGKDDGKFKTISSGTLPTVTQKSFVDSLDNDGREVFSALLKFGSEKNFPIHWGTKGLSMNVDKDGVHVVICYGYPPNSVFKQSIYTALYGRGGFLNKLQISESASQQLLSEALETGLFKPAGRELKVLIDRKFDDGDIKLLMSWIQKVVDVINNHELK